MFGAVKTFDLKEAGGETIVTKDNRKEYVDLYVKWLLVESVKGQYGPFERYGSIHIYHDRKVPCRLELSDELFTE